MYIPARSAHPPGVLFGIISGSVYRAYSLCSDPSDALNYLKKLWCHLRARGYSPSTLKPLFAKARKANLERAPRNRNEQPPGPPEHWLFKLTYHPQNPTSSFIQDAWQRCVAEPPLCKPLKDIDNLYRPLGFRRFIVCYRRSANLGNMLSYRKILPTSGRPVSSFCEEL